MSSTRILGSGKSPERGIELGVSSGLERQVLAMMRSRVDSVGCAVAHLGHTAQIERIGDDDRQAAVDTRVDGIVEAAAAEAATHEPSVAATGSDIDTIMARVQEIHASRRGEG